MLWPWILYDFVVENILQLCFSTALGNKSTSLSLRAASGSSEEMMEKIAALEQKISAGGQWI